jgi:uncharacterized protein YerC
MSSSVDLQSTQSSSFRLLEIPEVLLYNVLSFAAGPTHRCHVICHLLAPLSKRTAYTMLHHSSVLWDAILEGDYGVQNDAHHDKSRRKSKRLKQEPLQRVKHAHKMVLMNTQAAYHFLGELCTCRTKEKLTQRRLRQILEEYGPHLRLNDRMNSGGAFLVECCRAQQVRESVVLHCVQELVENRGALVDVVAYESPQSILTALCVAAARGMPTVVKYLLKKGASLNAKGTGRFRLYAHPRKTAKCTNATPLEFAETIRRVELSLGASENDVRCLAKCIQLLTRARKS